MPLPLVDKADVSMINSDDESSIQEGSFVWKKC